MQISAHDIIILSIHLIKENLKNIQIHSEERLISWQCPPSGWIKLNTDGSININLGWATVGGLARNSTRDFVTGFNYNIGPGNSVLGEL